MIAVYKVEESSKNIKEFMELKVNSLLGTFSFWNNIEEKYLEKMQISRLFDFSSKFNKTQEIWNLVDDSRLNILERIIMASSFDYCCVRKEYFPVLIYAFTSPYATEIMANVAECLNKLSDEEDCYGACICWNTVTDYYAPTYDENDEELLPTIDSEFTGYDGSKKKLWLLFEGNDNFENLLEEYKKEF